MEAISKKRIGTVLILSIIIAVFATFTLPQTSECQAASKAKITKVQKSKFYAEGNPAWWVTVTCNKSCQVEIRSKKKNKYGSWTKMTVGKKRKVHTCSYKSRDKQVLQFRVARSKDKPKTITLPAWGYKYDNK